MASVEKFYEDLSPHYHLLAQDWDEAVRQQGAVLSRLIERLQGPGPKEILDAACGIGTQALGLALHGHRVIGSDLSAPALKRAEQEAARLSVTLSTQVADMRFLTKVIREPREVVVVLDNAVAHFLSQEELASVAKELAGALRPSGLLLLSIRDYDKLREERPQITSFRVADEAPGRRVTFQVWDWDAQGEIYDLTQYVLRHRADGVETLTFKSRLRAVTRASLSVALRTAGLEEIQWLEPEDSGFYQPIVAARRP